MKSHFSWDFVLAPFQLKNIAVVNSSAKNQTDICMLKTSRYLNLKTSMYAKNKQIKKGALMIAFSIY